MPIETPPPHQNFQWPYHILNGVGMHIFWTVHAQAHCLILIFNQGTRAYDKLKEILMGTRIQQDIKKLSPDSQTSCLEGFHSLLNQFHPKNALLLMAWDILQVSHVSSSEFSQSLNVIEMKCISAQNFHYRCLGLNFAFPNTLHEPNSSPLIPSLQRCWCCLKIPWCIEQYTY